MSPQLEAAGEHFAQGMSRIAQFWGFPKAMGAVYAAIYLASEPLSLDALVAQVGVSKGTVSTNVRALERLGIVHRHLRLGDRRDYYVAETDFWLIVRGILRQREQTEFDRALRAVGESLEMLPPADGQDGETDRSAFFRERLSAMRSFFDALDGLVASLVALEGGLDGSGQPKQER
jgi:DNA-binding transcriptional regulator GbsR (MarR family)